MRLKKPPPNLISCSLTILIIYQIIPILGQTNQNDPYSNQNDPYYNQNDPLSSQNNPYSNQNNPYSNQNNPYSNQNNPYSNQNDPYSNQNDPYSNRNDPYSNQNDPYNPYSQPQPQPDPNQFNPNFQNDPFQNFNDRTNQNQFNDPNFTQRTDRPSVFDNRPFDEPTRNRGLHSNSVIINEATYFIVASRMVRPGQIYKVAVSILQSSLPLTVRGSIQRNGVELSSDSKDVKEGIPETLIMRVPPTSVPGDYKLRVEGLYDSVLGGSAFLNETKLTFSQRAMTIFIQVEKPIYMQNELVRFRTIPINTELRPFDDVIDVYMLDPKRHIMRRWLSRQSNLGTVSLDYQLSDLPVFGEWRIQVIAQGQVEELPFLVEEYYQTRFEVNITMSPFFFNNEEYISGTISANYTNGAPVHGNLTLKALIRPIRQVLGTAETFVDPRPPTIRYLDFQEKYPFWIYQREYKYSYGGGVPYLNYFNGVYHFKYPIRELEQYVGGTMTGLEVTMVATVGERFLDEIIEGYSSTRIYNSSIKIAFLGGTPQIVKPSMPFHIYIVASFHDGSPLPFERFSLSRMEIQISVEMREGGRRPIEPEELPMSSVKPGVWKTKIDLRSKLGLEDNVRAKDILNTISHVRIQAYFKDSMGQRANAELLMLSHYSPVNHQIKVATSTDDAKVGEYIIFHVQSNFYMEKFDYIIMSKGIVLLTSQEVMQQDIRTFAVTLSAEMAPVATIVVWHVGKYGDITADSLTFPVNGISRNNFTVFVNNKKARTGEKVEVAIYGEPGTYVGLSGIDKSFFTMQAGNELTYAKVITKMANFDEQTNGTHIHTWHFHEGNPDELVYFPSSTYGIDANRTFEYTGLIVFTDVIIPRRPDNCNITLGYAECLSSARCYRIEKRCDYIMDCEDGTDEANCRYTNHTDLLLFRKFRFNRVQRQYENVWMWKDINIGPHGRYLFNIDVPRRPAHWVISAFGMSPSLGFGMLQRAIEYIGVLPFFINVEMPENSRQGEQIGIRVAVFNYMMKDIEATVVLNGSPDYKFVHVELNGIVNSYAPRTSFGEHQFFVYIKAQDATQVFVPIVPTRLGDIYVTIHASTLIGKDQVTKKLHVTADGLPQHRHQAVLLDLSNRAYAFQYMHVNVTETPIIPYEMDRYYVFGSNFARISIVGDVVGPIFPTMPVNATSLLKLPMDSGEQNMYSFAANMYTTLYMRLVNQRNRTTEKWSFHYMNIGYQRQLAFLNPDGSFSLFRSDWNQSSPSVWLTAYCARIFQEASFYEWENYIYIDPQIIEKAVAWVLRHQTIDGSFYEVTWLPDRKLNQTTNWGETDLIKNRNISLTAHVLITLETVKDLTGGLGAKVALAQKNAIAWLERNMKLLEQFGEPHEVAIVAYALMLSKAPNAEHAFGLLARRQRKQGELTYWGREEVPMPPVKLENQKPFLLPRLPYKYDAENIETTAYALLTYVGRQELFIDPIVKWLNAQRLTDGGWASTQDSAVAYKALIEYTVHSRLRDISSLQVSIEATALPGQTKILYVTDKNMAVLQSVDIPEAWGTVKVQAKGAGYAILQMSVQYNVDLERFQTPPPVKAFDLITNAHFFGKNQSHITYTCCQRWINLNESIRSGMAILDVGIPTGYIIQQQDLDAYTLSRQVRNLQRAKFLDSKVIFYFDYLDYEQTCVNFTVERWYPVANMSRYLAVRVYDYYAPERFNETILDAVATYLLNICEVCGSSQCPYCPIYNIATSLPVPIITILIIAFIQIIRHFKNQNNGAVL